MILLRYKLPLPAFKQKGAKALNKIFTPHELKTIEVDAEKKIFRINGEDFGNDCTGFSIHCRRFDNFELRVEVDTTVCFSTYGFDQQKTGETEYQTNDTWFS